MSIYVCCNTNISNASTMYPSGMNNKFDRADLSHARALRSTWLDNMAVMRELAVRASTRYPARAAGRSLSVCLSAFLSVCLSVVACQPAMLRLSVCRSAYLHQVFSSVCCVLPSMRACICMHARACTSPLYIYITMYIYIYCCSESAPHRS